MRTWTNPTFKVGLPDGPWMSEFDKAQWVDPVTDLDCMMRRHPTSGHWCGYVGVPPGHALHGKHYNDDDYAVASLTVHGGVTFAEGCEEGGDEATAICHVPEAGRAAEVWWLGFDCAHAGDFSPGMARYITWHRQDFYRDADYVKKECELLALQIQEVQSEKTL